jgi:hypothetical protein
MLKKLFLLFVFFAISKLSAQEIKSLYQTKKVVVSKDTITLEKVSISPSFFKLVTSEGKEIDTTFYKVDFKTGKLLFKNGFTANDSITIRYFKYPEQLTKTYSIYDLLVRVRSLQRENTVKENYWPLATYRVRYPIRSP